MGLKASIIIKFEKELSINSLFDTLLLTGWEAYNNEIIFLDNDDYTWNSVDSENMDEVLTRLKKRYNQDKIMGIELVHKERLSGGNFIFIKKNELIISIDINRIEIKDTHITDFSLYLSYLNPIIKKYYCSYLCEDNLLG